MYDVEKVRADFPILSRSVNGKPLVYLDNGASAQKPKVVIDAMTHAYEAEYANVHRGLHFLSNLATEKYEGVRSIIARFLNVKDAEEIVFTTGTTEGINLVSYAWGAPNLKAGDEIAVGAGASRQYRGARAPGLDDGARHLEPGPLVRDAHDRVDGIAVYIHDLYNRDAGILEHGPGIRGMFQPRNDHP